MAKLFGTDGVRGHAGKFPLTSETIRLLGRSLATHLREKLDGRNPTIITGRDTRESGGWIEAALTAGITDAGAVCQSAGVITTPGVAFLARTLPADAGVVISASHNPYQDNGIKIFSPSGKKLDDATERLIENDILGGNNVPASSQRAPPGVNNAAAHFQHLYLDYLGNQIGAGLKLDN